MADSDVRLIEKISEEHGLTDKEESLFSAVVAGIYCPENEDWNETTERLRHESRVKNAVSEYFRRNPLSCKEILLH